MFNLFVGGVLGGTILSQLEWAIKNPGAIFQLLGTALPASSNYFANTVVARALAFAPLRMLLPHCVSRAPQHAFVYQQGFNAFTYGSQCISQLGYI